jgi:hypothetical protein
MTCMICCLKSWTGFAEPQAKNNETNHLHDATAIVSIYQIISHL